VQYPRRYTIRKLWNLSIQCTALFSAEIEQRLKVHSASRWQLVVFDTDDVLLVGPYSSSSCTTMGCAGRKGQ
jgi:hypothetical protein